jgi:hypothetical protein
MRMRVTVGDGQSVPLEKGDGASEARAGGQASGQV